MPITFADQMPQQLADRATVVQDALKALDANCPNVVSGDRLNQVIVNLPRFLPRSRLVRLVEQQFRPPTMPTS